MSINERKTKARMNRPRKYSDARVNLPGAEQHVGALARASSSASPGDTWLPERGQHLDPNLYPELAALLGSTDVSDCRRLGVANGYMYFLTNTYGVIYRTPDGVIFERVSTPLDSFPYKIYGGGWCIVENGDTLIIGLDNIISDDLAGNEENNSLILRSTDGGLTWALVEAFDNITGVHMAYNADKSLLVAAVGHGSGEFTIETSDDDGLTWVIQETITDAGGVQGMVYDATNDRFILVTWDGADLFVYYADDPTGAWTQVADPVTPAFQPNDIAASDDAVIVVGAGGKIMKSTDGGETWALVASGQTEDLLSAGFHPTINLFIVCGLSGKIATGLADASAFTQRTSGTSGALAGVGIFGTGVYVFDTTANGLRKSTNGTAWSAVADFDPQLFQTAEIDPSGDQDTLYSYIRATL